MWGGAADREGQRESEGRGGGYSSQQQPWDTHRQDLRREPGPALHGSLESPTCEGPQDPPWTPKGKSSHITGPVPGTRGG